MSVPVAKLIVFALTFLLHVIYPHHIIVACNVRKAKHFWWIWCTICALMRLRWHLLEDIFRISRLSEQVLKPKWHSRDRGVVHFSKFMHCRSQGDIFGGDFLAFFHWIKRYLYKLSVLFIYIYSFWKVLDLVKFFCTTSWRLLSKTRTFRLHYPPHFPPLVYCATFFTLPFLCECSFISQFQIT